MPNKHSTGSFPLTLIICIVGFADATHSADKDMVTVSSIATPIDVSCRGIAAASSNTVWVSGNKGTVIKTQDAGKSWQRVEVPDSTDLDFRDIAILPDKTVLLMSIGNGETSRVYRSEDQGSTWKIVLQNRAEKGFFNGIEFDKSGNVGFLVGDPLDGRLDVYRTEDAGRTWQQLPFAGRPASKKEEYGFAASGTGLAVTAQSVWIATGGSQASVWKRNRPQGVWERQPTPIRAGASSAGIFSICMTDDKNGIIIGGDYLQPQLDTNNVAATTDGRTWKLATGQKMPHKACVRSIGKGRFLAVGRTGIAMSTDRGTSWIHRSDEPYLALSVAPNNRSAWATGADGRVARITIGR